MATCTNTLAWEIPWTQVPGGLQSTGSRRPRHDRIHMQCLYVASESPWAQPSASSTVDRSRPERPAGVGTSPSSLVPSGQSSTSVEVVLGL